MNKQDWNKVWKEMIESLSFLFEGNQNIYNNCILPTKVIGIQNNNKLIISVPSIFAKSVIVNDCKSKLEELIKEKIQANIQLEFLLPEEQKLVRFDENLIDKNAGIDNTNSGLIKDFTLENFVVGEFNKSAYNAVCAIANKLGTMYNPLFLYGSTGLGKTHLIIALGNHFQKTFPNKRVKYIESDVFIRDVFTSLSKGSNFIEELKDYYNSVDLLLIDDIQYLAGKEKTNEIFFSIFNTLVKNNRQIVITSDKNPDELDNLEERMVSRFNSGLTLRINKPEVDALKRIVLNKIDQANSALIFNDDAILEIVKYYNNDLRKLIGAINQISFYAIQNLNPNEVITKEFIEQYIKDNTNLSLHFDLKINPDIVISAICKWYSIKEELVRGIGRQKQLVNIRHICMYVLRNKLNMSYVDIGKLFSNRDHTTVMSAVEKIEKQIKTDKNLEKYLNELYKKF